MVTGHADSAAARSAAPCTILLTDDQVATFVRDGIVVVQSTQPTEFHAEMDSRVRRAIEATGNWGNNILAQVPALKAAFDDPAVRGALSAVLGPSYATHTHRFAHLNHPGNPEQDLHMDSHGFSSDRHLRHHHPRWAIALYYPHDVTEDMGPTSVVPRSQYYVDAPHAGGGTERSIVAPAGSIAIVNFNIWHRGTTNRSQRPRLMVKFEFERLDEPAAPAWRNERADWEVEEIGPRMAHHTLWSHVWAWLRGSAWTPPPSAPASPLGPSDLASGSLTTRRCAADAMGLRGPDAAGAASPLAAAMRDLDEPLRLNAAYALGSMGGAGLDPLVEALVSGPDPVRRAAGHGLAVGGDAAAGRLVDLVEHEDEQVRMAAINAIGDLGVAAGGAVAAVTEAMVDANPWVRRSAAEALGTTAADGTATVAALAAALRDDQPFVRVHAAASLARIGSRRADAVAALANALADDDRYVRGVAVLALRRAGTPEAAEILLDHLSTARWCPDSTPADPY